MLIFGFCCDGLLIYPESLCFSVEDYPLNNNNIPSYSKVFKQHLQRSKQQSSSHLQHGKQSPLQGDHSTFSQYYPAAYSQTKPVPIPQVPSSPKNPMHTRKSVEGLNIELAGLEFDDKVDQVRFNFFLLLTVYITTLTS